jgi:hypothetical protein
VIITQDEIAPSDISHAKLFQPKSRVTTADDAAPKLRRSIESDVALNTLTETATDATSSEKPRPEPDTAKLREPATDVSAAAQIDVPARILASYFDTLEAKAKKPAPAGPVSVFISRKDKQLYVRQGMQALFNVPVSIRDDGAMIGTHVFTALDTPGGNGLRWIALAMPGSAPKAERRMAEPEYRIAYRYDYFGRRIPVRVKAATTPRPVEAAVPAPAAAGVLDRIDLPADVVERISEYMTAGATLIVSDHGISHETGAYTDFIVLTR